MVFAVLKSFMEGNLPHKLFAYGIDGQVDCILPYFAVSGNCIIAIQSIGDRSQPTKF